MRSTIAFLALTGLVMLPSCRGDVPSEAKDATRRQHPQQRFSPWRRPKAPACDTQVEPPGLFADSGGVELNPGYVGSRSAAQPKQSRSRHHRHRGGGTHGDDFPTLQSQQPQAFQDVSPGDSSRYSQQASSSPHGLSFTWQKQQTPITESLRDFFQTMLQQSPTVRPRRLALSSPALPYLSSGKSFHEPPGCTPSLFARANL